MKQKIIIIICLIGVLGLSSCRSTSAPCGFAENTIIKATQFDVATGIL